jgi:hypothetical protein
VYIFSKNCNRKAKALEIPKCAVLDNTPKFCPVRNPRKFAYMTTNTIDRATNNHKEIFVD